MAGKKISKRTLEMDIVRLHNATGRQRDELMAKLVFDLMENSKKPQTLRKRMESK